jgi:glycopeptide antibiotics resistance protein
MWQVLLHLTPVTVALCVVFLIGIAFAVHGLATWWPRPVARSAGIVLAVWVVLVSIATLNATESGGSGFVWSNGLDTLLTTDETEVSQLEKTMVVRQWIANTLMFTPLPILLAAARPGLSNVKILIVCLSFSFAIELIQAFPGTGRVADGEDVIFNGLGVVVGIGVGLLTRYAARYFKTSY